MVDPSAVVRRAVHNTDIWPDMVARIGYTAKGVVYMTVGVLALMTAIGIGGQSGGSKNAITALTQVPFGFFLVLLLTIGLACYSLWRWLQTITDPEDEISGDVKGWSVRFVHLVSAVIYTSLTVWAISLLMGSAGSSGSDDSSKQLSATLMQHQGGRWLIGIIGTCVIAAGIMEITKVVKQSFIEKLKLQQMNEPTRKAIRIFGSIGLSSRAVVFWIIGGSLIYTAWTANPDDAQSFGSGLAGLREQPYGWWPFVAVSFGVMAYGAFQIVKGSLRRVKT